MCVNAIPFGPPIGIIVFLTVPEDVTLGEIDDFTLDGPEFGINLGKADGFAESWVFSVPSLRISAYGMGNLFRLVRSKAKTRSSTKTTYPSAVLIPFEINNL